MGKQDRKSQAEPLIANSGVRPTAQGNMQKYLKNGLISGKTAIQNYPLPIGAKTLV